MYIEIKDNNLVQYADWEFVNSTFVDINYSTFNPSKYEVQNGQLVDISQTQEYLDKLAEERQEWFENNFFEIPTIGWIRNEFRMKNGEIKDFLFDGFPLISSLITDNQLPANSMVIYTLPDFTQELTEAYLSTLNSKNEQLTPEQTYLFVTTCKQQIAQGFFGV